MNLKNAIRQIADKKEQVYSIVGTVTAVDKSARTCEVEPVNGDATLFDVRLQADEDGADGVVIFPKIGSNVIVTFFDHSTGYTAAMSSVESIELVFNQLKIKMNTDGIRVEKNGVDLLGIMETIIDNSEKCYDFLIKLKVVTPTGTGLLSPDIIAQVTAEKLKLPAFRQQLKQLLV